MTDHASGTAKHRFAWWILGLSLGLGGFGQALLGAPLGLNLSLWVLAFALSAGWIARLSGASLSGWFVVALLSAVCLALRDSPVLNALNVLGVMVAFVLALTSARAPAVLSSFLLLFLVWFETCLNLLVGWLTLLFQEVPWRQLTEGRDLKALFPLARGAALTLPVLLVFGGLLVSADAAFGRLVGNLFFWRFENNLWTQLLGALGWFCVASGLLRLFTAPPAPWQAQPQVRLGGLELGMVLGALNLLFLLFIIVQFGYFFGGAANVTTLTGLTYAEYARRGSSELIAVAALTLPLLIAALHWREPTPRAAALIRGLSAVTVALLGVMLFSAWKRLGLYSEVYGLTEIRYYTAAFIIWLAGILLWFCLSALRERYVLFPRGVILAGFIALAALNALNPSAEILRTNVARMAHNYPFDVQYALRLGSDGVLAALEQPAVATSLILEYEISRHTIGAPSFIITDWRSWNFAKARAGAALENLQSR